MEPPLKNCNVIMGNLLGVENLLEITSPIKSSAGKNQQELIDAAAESMGQLHKQYPKATTFAYTYRLENSYWAILQHADKLAISKQYDITDVVDKVGSGDCFMA